MKIEEQITAGKRVFRRNLTPHFFDANAKDNYITVINDDFKEQVVNEKNVEYWTFDEEFLFTDCNVLLSFGEYIQLNESLSKAKGYDLTKSTQRVWKMNPDLAKVNRTFDEEGNEIGYDLMCVIEISADIQENYPELIEGLKLINPWDVVKAEDTLDILEAEDLTTETIDWLLKHYDKVGRKEDGLILWLGNEAPSPELLSVIENLVNAGLTISVIDNEKV